MYQPPLFKEDRIDVMQAFIRAHPFGLLVSAGAGGLMANPLPFVLDAGAGEKGILRGHFARANSHWRELTGAGAECLVVFQGPNTYVTPSWYPTKAETGKVVPTWNYTMVQVRGRAVAHDNTGWLQSQVTALTRQQEAPQAAPWDVVDAPDDFIAQQMRGIVGIEVEISTIEGKWKVSQNRPEADRRGVHSGLIAAGETAMAALVAERGGLAGTSKAGIK